ncbi:YqcC family protein [Pseudoalteromonas sp. GB56]
MYKNIITLLNELELQLKANQLWQQEPIDPGLLHSQQPFCIDTLQFEQWLQFVFIVKMNELIKYKQSLPTKIALAPMAEVTWKGSYDDVQRVLLSIDKLLGEDS